MGYLARCPPQRSGYGFRNSHFFVLDIQGESRRGRMDGHPRAWNIACGWRSYVDFSSPEGLLPPLTYFPFLFFDRRFSEWSAVLMDITYLGL